jgi:hypothetical protein
MILRVGEQFFSASSIIPIALFFSQCLFIVPFLPSSRSIPENFSLFPLFNESWIYIKTLTTAIVQQMMINTAITMIIIISLNDLTD